MKRLLDQWERKNKRSNAVADPTGWEAEIEDDEVMEDAPPPAAPAPAPAPAPPAPPPPAEQPAPPPADPLLLGPSEALDTVGICMLVEYMLAPPGAEEPQQLRAFWPDASSATAVPTTPNTEALHDFLFRLFATCMYTPECSVLAFMYVLRLLSYHPHLKVTPRNCQRLLLCSVIVAQKIHDDSPLRNVDFAVAWGRVLPGERPVPVERVNAMERVFLGALGFDLYVPRDQYDACVSELHGVVRHHAASSPRLPLLLDKHAAFMTGPNQARFPWVAAPPPRRPRRPKPPRQDT